MIPISNKQATVLWRESSRCRLLQESMKKEPSCRWRALLLFMVQRFVHPRPLATVRSSALTVICRGAGSGFKDAGFAGSRLTNANKKRFMKIV